MLPSPYALSTQLCTPKASGCEYLLLSATGILQWEPVFPASRASQTLLKVNTLESSLH